VTLQLKIPIFSVIDMELYWKRSQICYYN